MAKTYKVKKSNKRKTKRIYKKKIMNRMMEC